MVLLAACGTKAGIVFYGKYMYLNNEIDSTGIEISLPDLASLIVFTGILFWNFV